MEKPVFRLEERHYPDGELISTNTSFWRRIEFVEAVRGRPTRYYQGAIDSIDSVLPLLCIGHVSQAYLLLFQAAEVCLKGLLDELKSAGQSAWMQQNKQLAHNLAKNSTENVLTNIQEMHFQQAFRGANPIVDFREDIVAQVSELNRVRNEIAHSGGQSARTPYYFGLMLKTLFPMLDQFFHVVLRLDLADFILHPIARELIVIAKYYRRSEQDRTAFHNCLSHLHSAYFSIWQLSETGTPQYDEQGFSKFDSLADDYIKWQDQCRSELQYDPVAYDESGPYSRTTYCRICNQMCFVTTNWEERHTDEGLSFDVKEVKCPYCRLSIDDPLLAEIHYGRVSRSTLGDDGWEALLKDIGIEETTTNLGNMEA